MNDRRTIWIGNDHGGFELKMALMPYLEAQGYRVHNVGCDSPAIAPYPYYAAQVASAVTRGEADRGILICSTGIGMCIVANKFKGVRAALCTDSYMGRMTAAHNDANILCLGGQVIGRLHALDIVDCWLRTPYEGGRHEISLDLIRDAEETLCTGRLWHGGEEEGPEERER
ncbi:MAG: ribose 5-phosphate isomerase B [Anaerolineales bacterium]